MKTQITKKKLTIRSPKADAEAPEDTAATAEAPEGEAAAPVTVVPHAVPAQPAPRGTYTVSVILALVALVLFVALILLQVSEFNSLKLSFPAN
jgi:hypothetical protein